MRVLVVGSGGREHALAWALSKSPTVTEVISAPGSPGMARLGECLAVGAADLEGMADLAKRRAVDLVVVGPEVPLVAGLADLLGESGIRCFGPRRGAARLEGSKSFAKRLMTKYGIPTASAREFTRSDEALAYANEIGGPLVVKADGLASGKGVVVCEGPKEARDAIRDALERGRFGGSGRLILIEERLTGPELSLIAFCDAKTVLPLQPARDYKRVFDADLGPNTGGMGSYSPVAGATAALTDEITDLVLEPIAVAMEREAFPYAGALYAGLMITEEGPKVIEFNCRFGDPETQALLPRLTSDLMEPMIACTDGSLSGVSLEWSDDACVCVVASSGGYPGDYETGVPISGIEEAERVSGLPAFHAGTAFDDKGGLVTAGGRVIGVSATGDDAEAARRRAYDAIKDITFEGMHYRRDIAAAAAES